MPCKHTVGLLLAKLAIAAFGAGALTHAVWAEDLPPPGATKSARNFSKVIGWPFDRTPTAPEGFRVTRYAEALDNPRWIYVAPNGDVLVAESRTEVKPLSKLGSYLTGQSKSTKLNNSANRITLLRDADGDGTPELREIFLTDIKQPLGMVILNGYFYVAGTDQIRRYPYVIGQTKIQGEGQRILELPAGGYNNHWTRNLIARNDGAKLYVSVGSGSNVAEHGFENEIRRANILEINPDGTGERVYASGLRNPVGMAWLPGTNQLWTAVNERDELGDELVPDYLTSLKDGGFYGWPYSYFGKHLDPRIKDSDQRPDLVERAIVPDVKLGSHTASLGLAFYDGVKFPAKYRNGAFVGQHGSWNRSALVGYKVVFIPFANGRPSGEPVDFLTGFIADADKSEVFGRPVGVAVDKSGALLVADDSGNTIWRVAAE